MRRLVPIVILLSSVAHADTAPIEAIAKKLPKLDFAPIYKTGADSAHAKQANQLNTEGYVLHKKKDYANAAQKYLAALAADPSHVLARYNLACVYNLSGETPKGFALLVELARAPKCAACRSALEQANWDTDWQTQWGEPAFWEIERAIPGDDSAPPDPNAVPDHKLACPAGSKQVGTWNENRDLNTIYCATPAGVKNGPFHHEEMGYSMSEGRLSDSGSYRNGKQYGMWTHFESYGESYDGAYIDDVPIGHWAIFHRHDYGDRAYVAGKLSGHFQTRNDDGDVLVEEGQYVAGQKHGHYRTWDSDQHLTTEGDYDKDKQQGRWVSWSGGKMTTEGAWDHGTKVGTHKHYDDGTLIFVGTYDHDIADGPFEYYAKGKLVGKTTIAKGTGDWVEYSGADLIAKGKLALGKREGHWVEVESTYGEGDYAAGQRTGSWTWSALDNHAQIRAQGSYKLGKRTGKWLLASEDATARGSYADGKLEGVWLVFDDGSDSEPHQKLGFHAGKLVTVDGKAATKAYKAGFEILGFESHPKVVEKYDGPPMP